VDIISKSLLAPNDNHGVVSDSGQKCDKQSARNRPASGVDPSKRYGSRGAIANPQPSLHHLEIDFLESALTKAGLLSADSEQPIRKVVACPKLRTK
jgi:hypothetical protein